VVVFGWYVVFLIGCLLIVMMLVFDWLGLMSGYVVISNGVVMLCFDFGLDDGYEFVDVMIFDLRDVFILLREYLFEVVYVVEDFGLGFWFIVLFLDGEFIGMMMIVLFDELFIGLVMWVVVRSFEYMFE